MKQRITALGFFLAIGLLAFTAAPGQAEASHGFHHAKHRSGNHGWNYAKKPYRHNYSHNYGRKYHRFSHRGRPYYYSSGRYYHKGLWGYQLVSDVLAITLASSYSPKPTSTHNHYYVQQPNHQTQTSQWVSPWRDSEEPTNIFAHYPGTSTSQSTYSTRPNTQHNLKKTNGPGVLRSFEVQVPNSNGSYTPVTIEQYSDHYRGPKGEYYNYQPSVSQLRKLYSI